MVDKARWEEYIRKVEGEDMVIIDSWVKLKVKCENVKLFVSNSVLVKSDQS